MFTIWNCLHINIYIHTNMLSCSETSCIWRYMHTLIGNYIQKLHTYEQMHTHWNVTIFREWMHGHSVYMQHVHTQHLVTVLRKGRYVNMCTYQLVTVLETTCLRVKVKVSIRVRVSIVVMVRDTVRVRFSTTVRVIVRVRHRLMIRAWVSITARL